jgi:hypothetical protein
MSDRQSRGQTLDSELMGSDTYVENQYHAVQSRLDDDGNGLRG